MPRRRPNPKNKAARRQREAAEAAQTAAWLRTDKGQCFQHMLDLQQCCPELTSEALRRRHHNDESTYGGYFDLSGCSMTALPASIGSWKTSPKPLIGLDLTKCTKLTALPDEIGEIKTLKSLKLTQCSSLVALPDSIGKLGSLMTLVLQSCTSLAELPTGIGELGALTMLDLHGCKSLASLPDSIGGLKALTILDLAKCMSLTTLPESIGELKKLNYLVMAKCVKMCFLPYAIGGLEALKGFNLVGCTSLSALPDSIDELGALGAFSLAECSNLVLSRDALNGLGALQELDLGGCVKIDALDLDGLTNLRVLDATSVNLGLVKKDILALHKRRVKVRGFSVRKMMRALRDQAKRRRQRRLCDFCGWQGGIAEPRLPVCYCGRRRYCDENCQLADWGAGHSKTCRLGSLSLVHIVLLQRLEECRRAETYTEAQYRAIRDDHLSMTLAEAQDFYEKARQEGFFPDRP